MAPKTDAGQGREMPPALRQALTYIGAQTAATGPPPPKRKRESEALPFNFVL